jgi:hypothetical protein
MLSTAAARPALPRAPPTKAPAQPPTLRTCPRAAARSTPRRPQITINRPEKRNAFRPRTVQEMSWCFADAREDPAIGVIILTGACAVRAAV